MSYFWFISFVFLLVLEIITINLVSIWFAIGSVFAFFLSLFIDNIILQIALFIVMSGVSLFITKPFIKKVRYHEKVATNADRIIGKIGFVVKPIHKYQPGEIKVMGTLWTAVSDGDILENEEVIVEKIDGVKVHVKHI